MTVREASERFGFSRTALYYWASSGAVKVRKELRNGRAINLYEESELEKIFSNKQRKDNKNANNSVR